MGDLENTVAERLAAVSALRATLGSLTVEAGNADRSITVRVDVNGRMSGLTLGPRATEREPEDLADEIMHVMWAGQWQITAQVERTVRDALAGDPALEKSLRQAFDLRDVRPL